MESFNVVKFISIITIFFLGNSSAAMSKPAQSTRMKSEQQCTSEQSPISRRHSWSGSRKINVCEEDEEVFITQSSTKDSKKIDAKLVERQNFMSSIIAGVGSGSLASIVCAPLDLLWTRMQVVGGLEKNGSTNPKIIKSIYEIYASDGIRGCFRGL